MSQSAIAQLIGCSVGYVNQVFTSEKVTRPSRVTGKDGKTYPATRTTATPRMPYKARTTTRRYAEWGGGSGGGNDFQVFPCVPLWLTCGLSWFYHGEPPMPQDKTRHDTLRQ